MLTYEKCELCPRRCGINRTGGEKGFCRMPDHILAARAMLHYGEEPVLCGNSPTGAVFFSGCTLGCTYCQNGEISHGGKGKPLTSQDLRGIFLRLIESGASSIDLVTPTQFLPSLIPALTPKLPVPVIYNCGGYERVETLRELEGLIDVYLPDFKYSDNALAKRLSSAPDYFEVASAAIEKGKMIRGVLVRHLVLPGHLDNTFGVLERLAELFPARDVPLSLMSQYVPMGGLPAPLDRRLSEEEYASALSWMELCGLKRGFSQERSAATTELLPEFDFSGLF